MTKKNMLKMVDKIFWLTIAIFPLIVYAIHCIHFGDILSLETVLNNLGFGMSTTNIIYTTLNTIFGVGGGMLELTSSTGILLYGTYFITIMLLHFIIDMLLVIVRWGHHLLDKATKE